MRYREYKHSFLAPGREATKARPPEKLQRPEHFRRKEVWVEYRSSSENHFTMDLAEHCG